MNPNEATEEDIRKAGWTIGVFGQAEKWYNPKNDDGSRYCVDSPRAFRYIVEDHPKWRWVNMAPVDADFW